MDLYFSAQSEYEKDKNLKKEDIKSLQDWAKKQPHLPQISECQLILFLQSCYYRIEAAKSAIENYFTVRSHLPEVFQNRNFENILKVLDSILVTVLPVKTPEGYSITYTRYLNTDPDKYEHISSLQLFDMTVIGKFATEGTENGNIMVMDAHGQTLSHLMKMNLTVAKKFNFYYQEAVPTRLKGIHVIHAAPIVDRMMSIFRPFLNAEILALIHIHSDMETFYKFLPQEYLPKELGGKSPSFEELKQNTIQRLKQRKDFYKEEEKQLVDESKRVGKSKFLSMDVGMDGSFKKLNID